jgi:succinate dehydrogenase / fumarate reductase cytochrome b subunit
MTQPGERAEAPARSTFGFYWARLGSLLSMLPLGVWTINHLWDNLSAFSGKRAWEAAVTGYAHPVSHVATMLVVLLPLVLHTAWGVGRLFSSRPNLGRYRTYGNLKYVLQRLSAVGVLAFIGAHLWLAMIQPRLFEGHPETFEDISREMRFHGPTLVVYLLGTLGVAYHLGNGVTSFAWTWGLVSGRKSLGRIDKLAVFTFLVLLGLSWAAIYALYRAGGRAAYG